VRQRNKKINFFAKIFVKIFGGFKNYSYLCSVKSEGRRVKREEHVAAAEVIIIPH
jgi:hypothetical protein